MKHAKIVEVSRPHRPVTIKDLQLSEKEVLIFVGNAQLALCEHAPDDILPALWEYKTMLTALLQTESRFCANDLACVLVSVAYDLLSNTVKPSNSPLNHYEDGLDDEGASSL